MGETWGMCLKCLADICLAVWGIPLYSDFTPFIASFV